MKNKCLAFYLVFACLAGVILCISQASATLFVSGDQTPAYYAGDNDNNTLFENLLDGGTSVLVHEMGNSYLGGNLDSFYDSLAGVSSDYYQASTTITTSLLADVDFFVTGLYSGGLDAVEIGILSDFLDSGGSVLFMGEYTYAPTDINTALAALGSSMVLTDPILDPGTNYATVLADPYTVGVNRYHYGATYGVLGGTPLLLDSQGRSILSYEGEGAPPVPEPATLILLGTGLLGMVGLRRKKKS